MDRQYCVYIMANKRNGTLYIGMSGDLTRRVYEHRVGAIPGFTLKYGLKRLVYYESFDTPDAALFRERQMKKWNRAWKLDLIERENPQWLDLYDQLL